MKLKCFAWQFVMSLLCVFVMTSCDDDNEDGRKVTDYREYVLTVASERVPGVLFSDGLNYLTEVYAVKKEGTREWESMGYIDGFEFKKGWEYRIKISETVYVDDDMGQPAWTERKLLNVISKNKKASEGVPVHFVPEWYCEDVGLPQYRYVVMADNKELIEEEVKGFSPDACFFVYGGGNDFLKWIAIKDAGRESGPGVIKAVNKKPGDMPDSYKLLPNEGPFVGSMEWTFLDGAGNDVVYPAFDVFLGDLRNYGDMMPTAAYLYKDLTQYFSERYPDAGVRTVVISYTLRLR